MRDLATQAQAPRPVRGDTALARGARRGLQLLGIAALSTTLACARPPGMAGCATLKDTVAREECRYSEATALIADDAGLRAAIALIEEDASRDLLLSRLAVDHPARAPALCAQMKTPVFRDKCDRVIGRPHLAGAP